MVQSVGDAEVVIEEGMGTKIEVGLSWDFFVGMPEVDLDVAAVVFDARGQLIDAAFYKQLSTK